MLLQHRPAGPHISCDTQPINVKVHMTLGRVKDGITGSNLNYGMNVCVQFSPPPYRHHLSDLVVCHMLTFPADNLVLKATPRFDKIQIKNALEDKNIIKFVL